MNNVSFRYEKVADKVCDMIEEGLLKPGDKAPSLREMSKNMRVSVTTVMKAYMDLEARDILEAKPQSGFYIVDCARPHFLTPQESDPVMEPTKVDRFSHIMQVVDSSTSNKFVPLGCAIPSTSLLPVSDLTKISRKLSAESPDFHAYEEFRGNPAIRSQIAYQMLAGGAEVNANDLIVTNGATEALYCALKVLTRPGDMVAVESPCFFGFLQLLETLGVFALEINTHPDTGMDMDDLRSALARYNVKAVLVQPNFSNPLGCIMLEENKKEMVQMCADAGVPIIEDDVYGDIYFSEERPTTLSAYDEDDNVIHVSSFSKTLSPGYRVGWIRPGKYMEDCLRIKLSTSLDTAKPNQLIIAEYLASGKYTRHLRKFRTACKSQVAALSGIINKYFPEGTRMTRPTGGFVLWVEMPDGVDTFEFYKRALKAGISTAPGHIFTAQNKYRRHMRINCGHPVTTEIEDAVKYLGDMASMLLK